MICRRIYRDVDRTDGAPFGNIAIGSCSLLHTYYVHTYILYIDVGIG